jgi:hypothetical protein
VGFGVTLPLSGVADQDARRVSVALDYLDQPGVEPEQLRSRDALGLMLRFLGQYLPADS